MDSFLDSIEGRQPDTNLLSYSSRDGGDYCGYDCGVKVNYCISNRYLEMDQNRLFNEYESNTHHHLLQLLLTQISQKETYHTGPSPCITEQEHFPCLASQTLTNLHHLI